MSVPPLVCSTPPPPDQCDDEADDDEISFNYKDPSLSPSELPNDHINVDTFTNFNYPLPERCSPVHIEIKSSPNENTTDVNFQADNISDDVSIKSPENNNIKDIKNHNQTIIGSEEEYNIEDLDLRLESLQLDFQNGKESVEDNLNDTFDDFGTFLGTQILNDLSNDSFYLPKIETQDCASSKNDTSEESASDSSPTVSKVIEKDENDTGFDLNNEATDLNVDLTNLPNQDVETSIETVKDTLDSDNIDSFSRCDDSNNILWTADSVCFVDSAVENVITENTAISDDAFEEKIVKSDFVESTDAENTSYIEYSEPPPLLFNSEENKPNYHDDIANSQLEIDDGIDDDFNDFATFQSAEIKDIFGKTIENTETVFPNEFESNSFEPDFQAFTDPMPNINVELTQNDKADEVDDFGEFDTYVPGNMNVETCNFEAVNYHNFNNMNTESLRSSSDTDVIEKLCSAVGNIFAEDISSDGSESIDEQLELNMNLGESWRHLVNYDAQQSYLFPWNNSASQKTLLKCLGIDSRNILFGPKWNVNMPRFAANLGISPLQPIRQGPQNNDQFQDSKSNDVQNAMSQNKDGDWESGVEYCGADFQTSSYAESLLLDLEHLMATLDQMTSGQSVHFKISDLFTNACNERDDHIKPEGMDGSVNAEKIPHPSLLNIGRKINLPDTHIFTPTDSETPWSHTIHYDDDNINDISNPAKTNVNKTYAAEAATSDKINTNVADDFDDFQSFDNNKTEMFLDVDKVFKQIELSASAPSKVNTTDFNDYFADESLKQSKIPKNFEQIDDFGDFQSAEFELSNQTQTQLQFNECNVLEPIRVTPAMPVVNWPAPGEINVSIFDDISDVKKIPLEETQIEFTNARPPSFILKESKIVTENRENSTDSSYTTIEDKYLNTNTVPETSFSFQNQFNGSIPNGVNEKTTKLESKIIPPVADDFSDFHSTDYIHPVITPALKPSQNYEINLPQTSIPSNTMLYTKNDTKTSPMYAYEKPVLEPTPAASRQHKDVLKNTTQQILQPLSLENYSQINWPDPGIDLQDLTRFNPVNSIKSYSEAKDSPTKVSSSSNKERVVEDDWSDFVSNKLPNSQYSNSKPVMPNMLSCNGYNVSKSTTNTSFDDNDDWSEFVSSSAPPRNVTELKTISQNIHSQKAATNYAQKSASSSRTVVQNNAQTNVNVLPHLSYASTRSSNNTNNNNYNGHFQNL